MKFKTFSLTVNTSLASATRLAVRGRPRVIGIVASPGLKDARDRRFVAPMTMETYRSPTPAPRLGVRPRLVMLLAVGVATLAGWAYLGAMIAAMVPEMDMATFGPGMEAFNAFNRFAGLSPDVRAALAVLCLPVEAHFGMPGQGDWGPRDLSLVFVMWVAMAMAMMLPTAVPVFSTYAEEAEAKLSRAERSASVLWLIGGYFAVWVGYSLVATLAQWGLTELRALNPAMGPASLMLAGTTLVAAGVYQFTPAKQGCLIRCQMPTRYIVANWSKTPIGVFRLGIEQGLFCLGCCFALMTVMFAVGVMNVIWIAVIGLAMIAEKTIPHPAVSRVIGVALIAWGAALIWASPIGNRLLGA